MGPNSIILCLVGGMQVAAFGRTPPRPASGWHEGRREGSCSRKDGVLVANWSRAWGAAGSWPTPLGSCQGRVKGVPSMGTPMAWPPPCPLAKGSTGPRAASPCPPEGLGGRFWGKGKQRGPGLDPVALLKHSHSDEKLAGCGEKLPAPSLPEIGPSPRSP